MLKVNHITGDMFEFRDGAYLAYGRFDANGIGSLESAPSVTDLHAIRCAVELINLYDALQSARGREVKNHSSR